MTYGTIGWVQVGTHEPTEAKRFYGELFSWTFADGQYAEISAPGVPAPLGGLATTDDAAKNHAIFFVIVDDVAKALEKAENLGGKALTPATTTPDGLTFAHVQDPAGNEFGIFTPPAA
ncbi:VOC family protein [Kibdelosporangium lantanae]